MWVDLEQFVYLIAKKQIKTVITGSDLKDNLINRCINMILLGKFHIHKLKIQKSKPSFKTLLFEYDSYIETLKFLF